MLLMLVSRLSGSNHSWERLGFLSKPHLLFTVTIKVKLMLLIILKHFKLNFNYLRQLVQEKVITLIYCRTYSELVDIFTKPLSEVKFLKFHTFLGLQGAAIIGGV